MNKQQQLTKLIEIARNNGWKYKVSGFNYHSSSKYWWDNPYMLNGFLLSEDFAKAIWGENERAREVDEFWVERQWQYHLQQAVISKDVIEYYYENAIKGKETI